GGGSSPAAVTNPTPPPAASVYTVPAAMSLSTTDVEKVISQAVGEAKARQKNAVIAVTDRAGNVLAIFAMTTALNTQVTVRASPDRLAGPSGVNLDLQGVQVSRPQVAVAKAITGAYLSSAGNAFSTRTASMIVQE